MTPKSQDSRGGRAKQARKQPTTVSEALSAVSSASEPPVEPSGRRIAILGCMEDSTPTPFRAPGQIGDRWDEFWTLNSCGHGRDPDRANWYWGDSVDRVYELHHPADRPWRDTAAHREYLSEQTQVVSFYPKQWGLVSRRTDYPIQQVLDWAPRRYFTNSVAWMIAHALYEHSRGQTVSRLGLFGLHFASPHERWFERACTEWWLGYAQGLGIEVVIPITSPLVQGEYLYGLQQVTATHEAWYRSLPGMEYANYLPRALRERE